MTGSRTPLAVAFLVMCLAFIPRAAQAQWLSPGPTVPTVQLVDEQGKTWNLGALLRDRSVLISFFFTGCITICPTQTATMRLVQEEIKRRQPKTRQLLLLSISLDPLGDTPAAMKQYAQQFDLELGENKGWLMLTGSYRDLQRIWAAFEQPNGAPADHTAMLWVGQPKNKRWTRVSALTTPEVIADLFLEQPQ